MGAKRSKGGYKRTFVRSIVDFKVQTFLLLNGIVMDIVLWCDKGPVLCFVVFSFIDYTTWYRFDNKCMVC